MGESWSVFLFLSCLYTYCNNILTISLCVADMVLDHQEASHELDDSVRVRVREALLKRHHHQNEKKKNLIPIVRSITEGTRKQSEPHLTGRLHSVDHTQKRVAELVTESLKVLLTDYVLV